ncbi:MAG: molybdenum cofactor biosynthesis protein MoaE [Candidatus Altiarchaeota archaeon]|nr:molybdenum cofactor biosynthesis protein MoaE [Candidatus Altiarchaeota archaeon]
MCEMKDTGAIVHFTGVVRSENNQLWGLDYESYDELAVKEIEKLKQDAIKKFGVLTVFIQQKIGSFPAGTPVFHVIVHAHHRKEAFEACSWLVTQFKERVPVWKHEVQKG